MSSGTSADIAACMTLYDLGAKRGDEIIAPALAFAAVGNSIVAAGFKPVFVDIERKIPEYKSKIEKSLCNYFRSLFHSTCCTASFILGCWRIFQRFCNYNNYWNYSRNFDYKACIFRYDKKN